MFQKETKKMLVSIDKTKIHNDLKFWETAVSPEFYSNGVDKFKYISDPSALYENEQYHILNGITQFNTAKENGAKEIMLDVVEIKPNEVMRFIITNQYPEHKEPRFQVEMTRLILGYLLTTEGRSWAKENQFPQDKEALIAIVLGVSNFAAKCLIKLAHPSHKKYAEMLLKSQNSISGVYKLCCDNEKAKESDKGRKSSSTSAKPDTKVSSPTNGESITPSKKEDVSSVTIEQSDNEDLDSIPPKATQPTASTNCINFSNIDGYKEMIEKYRKVSPGPADSCFKQLVTLHLHDGKTLELNVYVQLEVDGSPISSVNQLEPLPNGNWTLPKHSVDFKLIVLPAVVNSIVDVTHFAENSESKNVA